MSGEPQLDTASARREWAHRQTPGVRETSDMNGGKGLAPNPTPKGRAQAPVAQQRELQWCEPQAPIAGRPSKPPHGGFGLGPDVRELSAPLCEGERDGGGGKPVSFDGYAPAGENGPTGQGDKPPICGPPLGGKKEQ